MQLAPKQQKNIYKSTCSNCFDHYREANLKDKEKEKNLKNKFEKCAKLLHCLL